MTEKEQLWYLIDKLIEKEYQFILFVMSLQEFMI